MSRTLGASGPVVSPLGLGLAALGRPGYITLGHGEDLGGDRSVEALERHAHAVLDAAYQAGIRYLDAARSYGRAEAFLASWLTARNEDPALKPLRALAEESGTSVDAVALAAVLAQPWVSVVLSGASTVEQLRSNLRALEVELGMELLERLRGLVEAPETYWEKRASLPWN